MRLWPFRKRDTNQAQPVSAPRGLPVITDFPGDLEDAETLKYYGVRALCGTLMDRHDDCRSAHPFCGPNVHRQNGDSPHMTIAHIIPQGDSNGTGIVGIYLCKAVSNMQTEEDINPFEFALRMACAGTTPHRKMTVQPVSDGSYYIRYGTVLNPTEGDHSTGRLDQETAMELRSVPEPQHTQWEYYRSQLASGPLRIVPEIHCLQVFGEWWIVDVDRERMMGQQVAALTVANSPHHSF